MERAIGYKDCYLKLQDIFNSKFDENEKLAQYAAILKQYENQSDIDYDEMLFSAFLRGQKLYNSHKEVTITFFMAVKVLIVRIARFALYALLFYLPVGSVIFFR